MKDYKIYICTTYYHVLISIVKAIQEETESRLVLTAHIPQITELAERIGCFHIFEHIRLIGEIKEYTAANKLEEVLFFHWRNKQCFKKQLFWERELRQAAAVYIFHDDTWVSHYLKEFAIPYTLLEDALDSFTIIDRSPFAYMLPSRTLRHRIRKKLNIGYFFLQECPYVKQIEVNSLKGLKIPADDRVFEVPRKKLFEGLTPECKKMLITIFGGNCGNQGKWKNAGVLILTQPLYEDGLVSDMEKQKQIYFQILKRFQCGDGTIYIKPHPRDICDYTDFDAVILNRFFPVEILNYQEEIHFKKIVTVFSTAIQWMEIADEKICMDIDELIDMQNEVKKNG